MRKDVMETRDAICRAVSELIQERPYDDFTVQEIVARAGVSRSSFYNHFTKKDDAMDMLIDRISDRIACKEYYGEKNEISKEDVVDGRRRMLAYCRMRRNEIRGIYKAGFESQFGKALRKKLIEVRRMFAFEVVDEKGNTEIISEGKIYEMKVWNNVNAAVAAVEMFLYRYPEMPVEEFCLLMEKADHLTMTGGYFRKENV